MSRRRTKAADTRISILEAALERLDERALADIPAKELADAAGVSTATFFNYFPSKDRLLALFVQLWTIEMAWISTRHPADDPLGAIEAMLQATAEQSEQHPGILAELITFQARHRFGDDVPALTDEDVLRMFPEHDGIVHTRRDAGLETLIPPLLTRAIELGRLRADTHVDLLLAAIASVFFGAPIIAQQSDTLPLTLAYRTQLDWLWSAHAPVTTTG